MAKNDIPVGSFGSGNGNKEGENASNNYAKAYVKDRKMSPTAQGKIVKKSLSDKFNEAFVRQDMKTVGGYLLTRKIVPDLIQIVRDAIFDAFTMHFGLDGSRGGKAATPSGYTNYQKASSGGTKYYYESSSSESKPKKRPDGPADFREISFDSESKAIDVLGALRQYAREYTWVSVYNFYDASQLTGNAFTDHNWGWKLEMLENLTISYKMINHELRYFIDFPDPVPIKD